MTAPFSLPVIRLKPKANARAIREGEEVQFTDESGHAPTTWAWDFGDAGMSTQGA